MLPVKKVRHNVRDTDYELLVYKVKKTGEYKIYVAKEGFGVGDIFTATQEVVQDAKKTQGVDIVEGLISTAIDDINRNEFGLY
jgi:hypothetical protein